MTVILRTRLLDDFAKEELNLFQPSLLPTFQYISVD